MKTRFIPRGALANNTFKQFRSVESDTDVWKAVQKNRSMREQLLKPMLSLLSCTLHIIQDVLLSLASYTESLNQTVN